MAESETEDDETGWVTAFFGPPSPRRNLWLFVSSTGTIGLILAIILLFNGKAPEEARIATQPESKPEKTIEKEPPAELEALPLVEQKPEQKPEEPVIVERTPEPEPEPQPEPAPIVDDISVKVELLPAPGKNQGEQFEVTGENEQVDPETGFADLAAAGWQKANLLAKNSTDAWKELQKLVPLEPYGPKDVVDSPAVNEGTIAATFRTTQPKRAGQSLLMPFELTVTNTGTSSLDRVILEQSLPESVKLHDAAAVHASGNRTLRWEHERLGPQELWNIPIVTVPTQQGQIVLPTTLSVGNSVSAQTLVQTPDVKLVMTCRPAARFKKYHQIVFKITNTGEVPLHNLLIDIHLTGNLWHRFGQDFEFFHKQLDVGKTREALLHVKTRELGDAQLQAVLVTDEGAQANGLCQFTVVENGKIDLQNIPSRPATNTTREEPAPQKEREWQTRPESDPRLVPDAADPFSLPSAPKPKAKPVSQPKPGVDAFEAAPVKQPGSVEEQPSEKPEAKPADEIPIFPGELGPLPERKPVVPPKQPLETESSKESPFDPPAEKTEGTKTPAEDPFDPMTEDPFESPKKEPDFFGDE